MSTSNRRSAPFPAFAILIAAMTLAGCAATTSDLELRSFARADKPAEVLACPPGYCAARADLTVPDYPIPLERLAAIVREAVTAIPRTTIERDEPARQRLVAVQRTAVLRFPDTIWIELIARGPASSSVAIYSRSNFGYYDFGVNRRRVEALLAAVAARVAASR